MLSIIKPSIFVHLTLPLGLDRTLNIPFPLPPDYDMVGLRLPDFTQVFHSLSTHNWVGLGIFRMAHLFRWHGWRAAKCSNVSDFNFSGYLVDFHTTLSIFSTSMLYFTVEFDSDLGTESSFWTFRRCGNVSCVIYIMLPIPYHQSTPCYVYLVNLVRFSFWRVWLDWDRIT